MTRDEAIAIARRALTDSGFVGVAGGQIRHGARLALEALDAAGVFVVEGCPNDLRALQYRCAACGAGAGEECRTPTMADRLDAAGIR